VTIKPKRGIFPRKKKRK